MSPTQRMAWPVALLLAACGGPGDDSAPPPPPVEPPTSLVLFTVDTLRADHLGPYGYERPTSPTLDRFAVEATVFEQVQAPRALTWPALTTILTGREVHDHGVRRNGERPREALTTLATVLAEKGYRTAAFLSNACEADLPGFEERGCSVAPGDLKHFRWDRETTDRALAYIARAEEPFFLWVHLMDPHWPYKCAVPTRPIFDADYQGDFAVTRENLLAVTATGEPLAPEDHQHVVNRYDCQVRHTDDRFGEVLGALDRRGLLRRSLVAFTADHGEELADHDQYYYHAASIYQGTLGVPLLVRHPSLAGAGRRVDEVVGLLDLAPTLLDLMGHDPAALGPVAGRSFAARVTGEGEFTPSVIRGEVDDQVVVLRDGRYKYVGNLGGGAVPLEPDKAGEALMLPIVREALFDLEADPGETRSLLDELPEIARAMRTLAAELRADPHWPHRPQEMDPELRERLRGLGYASN